MNNNQQQQQQQFDGIDVSMHTNNIGGITASIYITGPIMEPQNYHEAYKVIRQAGKNDIVNLYINTRGGHVATYIQIENAIRESGGTVVAHVDGEAMGVGLMIMLSAHAIVVGDHIRSMIHLDYVKTTEKWLFETLKDVAPPILTEEELEQVRSGNVDLYFTADELRERLKKGWGVEIAGVIYKYSTLSMTDKEIEMYQRTGVFYHQKAAAQEQKRGFFARILGFLRSRGEP